MTRRLFSLTMVLVLATGMAATGWVPGATGFSVQLAQAKTAAAATTDTALMSNLRGSTVYDSSHQQIGTVDAVVINTNTSQIEYVVVGTGGSILGMGKEEIPVPWADVQVTQANAQGSAQNNSSQSGQSSTAQNNSQTAQSMQYAVTMNITKTKFGQAPQIDLSKLQNQGQLSVSQSSNQSSSSSNGSQASNNSSTSQSQASSAQAQQQIQSFWQSNATTMSGATGTSQSGSQASGSQTTQSGTAQLVLAQSLIGATLQGQATQQGMSNQGSSQSQQGTSGQQGMQTPQSNNSQSSAGSQTGQTNSQTSQANNLGQVKDILVNLQAGKVEFALVALNQSSSSQAQGSNNTQQSGSYGYQQPSSGSAQQSSASQSSAQQLVPVPLKDLTWTTQGQVLTYTGNQSLQQAPTVTLKQVQNSQNVSWQSKVDSFWGVSAA